MPAPNSSIAINPPWVDWPDMDECQMCAGCGLITLDGEPWTGEAVENNDPRYRCPECGGRGEVVAK